MALTNLGMFYIELGRRQEALASLKEAVKIRRELPKTNTAFVIGLAYSLANLAMSQLVLGQPEQARSSIAEAKAIIRPLADTNPALYEEFQRLMSNLEKMN
jgi:Flp pilus assembly protein TadD